MAKRNYETDQWELNIPEDISEDDAKLLTQLTEREFRIAKYWSKPIKRGWGYHPFLITNNVGALELYGRGYKPRRSKQLYSDIIRKFKSKRVKKEKKIKERISYAPVKRKIKL